MCQLLLAEGVPGTRLPSPRSGQRSRQDESRARRDIVERDPLCDKLLAVTRQLSQRQGWRDGGNE